MAIQPAKALVTQLGFFVSMLFGMTFKSTGFPSELKQSQRVRSDLSPNEPAHSRRAVIVAFALTVPPMYRKARHIDYI